jgi:hypothetical protein
MTVLMQAYGIKARTLQTCRLKPQLYWFRNEDRKTNLSSHSIGSVIRLCARRRHSQVHHVIPALVPYGSLSPG